MKLVNADGSDLVLLGTLVLQNPITHQGCGCLRSQLCSIQCLLGASPARRLEALHRLFLRCQQLRAKCPLVPQQKHSTSRLRLHSLVRWPVGHR